MSGTQQCSSGKYISVAYMHAPRSIQMNYYILFLILSFYFTLSIILIHSQESPLSLYFLLFYFQLFMHLFTTLHFTFASASRLHVHTDILVRADTSSAKRPWYYIWIYILQCSNRCPNIYKPYTHSYKTIYLNTLVEDDFKIGRASCRERVSPYV